jgi:hypothetical protein
MRIQDYNQFASVNPRKNSRGEYSFTSSLGITDIVIENAPEDMGEISDLEATIEYSVNVMANKEGIDSISFSVDMIELEVEVDNYPDGTKEMDLDIAPGQNIEKERIREYSLDQVLPTYPSRIEVNMNKTFNVSNFIVSVYFGKD